MKNLICTVEVLSNGVVSAGMGCFDVDENLDVAVTQTLLELIEQAVPLDNELEKLVAQAKDGHYVSSDTTMPDWGVNDINVWLTPPMAQPGHICITNENTEFSSDDACGRPQQFTYEQFRVALQHWREFLELLNRKGREGLIGQKFEIAFPD